MADAPLVRAAVEDGVMTITLDNPPSNQLAIRAVDLLDRVCQQAQEDGNVRAVLIAGEGSHFSAGADVVEIGTVIPTEHAAERSALGINAFSRIEALPVPVIAAIRGLCLGGGLELAMACHIRLCSDRARLGQPEVNLGLIPGWGGTQRLPRLVGRGRALKMLLTGEMISAQQALQLGIVDEVLPDAQLMAQARGLAQRLAAKSRPAVRLILKAVREGLKVSLVDGLNIENAAFGEVCAGRDAREGVAAFLEKRQPVFQDP